MFKDLFTEARECKDYHKYKVGDIPCKCVKMDLKSKDKYMVKITTFAKDIGGNC